MDKVRFGRALGVGAREAAKALMKAADAAAAPDPAATSPRAGRVAATVRERVVDRAAQARATTAGVKRGGRRFGEAMWGPFAKLSAVLWLEVTGVVFGLIAAVMAGAVYRDRASFGAGGSAERHAWIAAALFVVFAYFTVTSYTRAARRGRK